ncbi:IstB-like ATP-binding protein [Magnetococcus marinus MC-1]|uniref:IstB-like ATP-binding protein n=1 Tax=Magnetococcus marinus (strain ATCC BAA-1437 / JCM 17883 / MC-1) TaxID=156889 RepID=A0LAQ3_MAGMM|nr:ATP-binding protein [Magnetococcus marinus]ABK45046.1 IstB-like ATP-binding protein [Magnetococcus marinus MC-1]
MRRHELIDGLKRLKLHGMVAAFDEVVVVDERRNRTIHEILGALIEAEQVERKVRSIHDQMSVAKFPSQKNLDSFDSTASSANEGRIRTLQISAS